MTNNDELAMQAEQCANILENISGFEPDDIDGDAVDLRFDLDGMDTGCTVSLVEQCQHASDALRSLLAERDADKKRISEFQRKEYYRTRQAVIDGLAACGECWDDIKEYMERWDAEAERIKLKAEE